MKLPVDDIQEYLHSFVQYNLCSVGCSKYTVYDCVGLTIVGAVNVTGVPTVAKYMIVLFHSTYIEYPV